MPLSKEQQEALSSFSNLVAMHTRNKADLEALVAKEIILKNDLASTTSNIAAKTTATAESWDKAAEARTKLEEVMGSTEYYAPLEDDRYSAREG